MSNNTDTRKVSLNTRIYFQCIIISVIEVGTKPRLLWTRIRLLYPLGLLNLVQNVSPWACMENCCKRGFQNQPFGRAYMHLFVESQSHHYFVDEILTKRTSAAISPLKVGV